MSRPSPAAAALLLALALCGGARAQRESAAPVAAPALAASSASAVAASSASAVAAAAAASAPAAAASQPRTNAQFRVRPVDDAWRRGLPRDADAATQAYLDRLPPDVVARSNAYFEGNYWYQLWTFLAGLGVAAVLLGRGRAARVRDACARIGRGPWRRDALFGAFYAGAGWTLTLPLTIWHDYWREHAYGMANQTFGPWFGQQLVGAAVDLVFAAIAVPVFYAALRRAGERWWLWGTGVALALMTVAIAIAPVWIDPLFNTYKPVSDPAVREAVLHLARIDGVPVHDVYQFDASRQTTQVSANVAGLFGTASVRLNDNLLRCSLPEIRAVTGHELGHYVLNHIDKSVCEMAIVIFCGFLFAQWAMARLLARAGARWGLRGVQDVASLPLLAAVMSVYLFLATPVTNTLTRTQEIEADRFGLNLAREPHGAAEAYLKLTEYRKPDPGPIEEFVFYDHPSTRFRIHDAMRWREEMGTP
jgi:STE24 endopeptidase